MKRIETYKNDFGTYPKEIKTIRRVCEGRGVGRGDFNIVTPGIRFTPLYKDDQRRSMSPYDAISLGADYIVMGRAILNQDDPLKAIELINKELEAA